MKWQHFLSIFLFLLLRFPASAITVPASSPAPFVFEDSLNTKVPVLFAVPAKEKKVGFWGKVKNKITTFLLQRQLKAGSKGSLKSTLGWISLGLIVLSLGLLAFASGGGVGILFLLGLLTGLVSLFLPRNKEEKAQNKNSSKGAIIGLALGVGFVLAIVIIFSAANWH